MAKLLILTADKTTLSWRSLDKKLATIKTELNSIKNANFQVDILYTPAIPQITEVKRIDGKWLDDLIQPYYKQGYDFVGFHFSKKQDVAWGIIPKLGGANPRFDSGAESFYWWSDEHTIRKNRERFVETCLHEFMHGFFQKSKLKDITHETDEKYGTVTPALKTLDWSLYPSKEKAQIKQINALQGIVEALTAILAKKPATRMIHPVEQYRELISRAYGVEDRASYPQTGHHIGTDYACPVGTPVKAPYDGEITVIGNSPALGNFCHYKYTFENVTYMARFMHLSHIPIVGKYKRGEVIELSGKTGKVSGPHLHIDIFFNDVRVDLLTEKNFTHLTINPETHYA